LPSTTTRTVPSDFKCSFSYTISLFPSTIFSTFIIRFSSGKLRGIINTFSKTSSSGSTASSGFSAITKSILLSSAISSPDGILCSTI